MDAGCHIEAGESLHVHVYQTASAAWRYELFEFSGQKRNIHQHGYSAAQEACKEAAVAHAKLHLAEMGFEAPEAWDCKPWTPIRL
jgi:hypothetical protein